MSDWFRDELTRLSGSGKRVVGTRRHGLYSTITIPEYTDMPGVRNTQIRFKDFGIPASLAGKSFLDVGANVGAMAFEAARRGANVTGIEFRLDRVMLCNSIGVRHELDAVFYQADFNAAPGPDEIWRQKKYDIVLCCSVTEYITDLPAFYRFLGEMCAETLYLECNCQRGIDVADVYQLLMASGFENLEYLGNGHSGGISRKRKLYSAQRKP